jgi:hypothetical protein
MSRITRRGFLGAGLGATVLAGTSARQAGAASSSATDWVPLGKSGVEVTRLAFGCGTSNGRVQAALGQEEFTRLVRHAYDQGIRFFETSETYVTPAMLGEALKGIPRDSYRLMTKLTTRDAEADPQVRLDLARKALNTDYFDILLIHCVMSAQWPDETRRFQDAYSEAKARDVVLAHGASVHGLPALAAFPGNRWLDVAMIRVNHAGVRMDSENPNDFYRVGNVEQVVAHARKVHDQGTGVIGMKLVGEGEFKDADARDGAMSFAMGLGVVDTVSVGFKSTQEIDETIERMNRVLNA